LFVWLLWAAWAFFTYLAAVIIYRRQGYKSRTRPMLSTYSSVIYFTCHTYCNFLKSYRKTRDYHFWMLRSCRRSNHYLLASLTTFRMLSESSIARLL
jgi:hypothetical protein